MDLEAGRTIGTQLTLVKPLDSGAMGAVWVAKHRTLRTEVAIKFIDPKLVSEDPASLARFRHEASASARLKSPHVVQVFDHDFTIDGTPYIVMELLEGETLKERLDRGTLSLFEAVQVATHMSRALSRAHGLGVIHRDIKPENIFLCKLEDELFCKLFDFGIAKQVELPELDQLTHPGLLVGTPEFMSPELFSNKRAVDAYADLWALAAVLYYALTKKLPFPGENVGELCTNLMTKEAPAISSVRADAPPELDAWFARALAKDPAQRFDSARTMAKSFLRAVSGASLPDDVRLSNPDLSAEALSAISRTRMASGRPLSQSTSAPFTLDSGDGGSGRPRRSRMIALVAIAALGAAAGVVATRMAANPVSEAPAPQPAAPEASGLEAEESHGATAPSAATSSTPDPSTQAEAPEASASAAGVADGAASSASASPPANTPMPTRAPGSRGYDWAF
jgi:serine/threonine-protein kinase